MLGEVSAQSQSGVCVPTQNPGRGCCQRTADSETRRRKYEEDFHSYLKFNNDA